ncbi:helix-turn-helix domain-containing protein [Ruegeria profundi]|uniref:helix-turn-helix domain-containing protein n=1 Tax=Ruegeria profundi TaxID=1685378 RepID=UPI001CD6F189|nr:helix-turn-helix transcriptional regulator [Ruegeria profundi]MCA0927345.1 helix-turn-helix domain-containing protein [Ruegeria profundi]
MAKDFRNPDELRRMFGANLRQLAKQYTSISELCRHLGVNRTQFNRYLGGESFPRPDVLDRICRFFDVDARILLQPLDEIDRSPPHPAAAALTEFLGSGPKTLTESLLPAGFYYATETEVDEHQPSRHRLYYVRRLPQCTLVRGFEPKASMPGATPNEREVQGIAASAGRQIYILMSSRAAQNSRIYLVTRGSDENSDHWRGVAICLSKTTANVATTRRILLRHLGNDTSSVLAAARTAQRAERTFQQGTK